MKQSHLFGKTLREAPKDESAVNARLLLRAGFIDKLMAGVYSYLPLGFRVFKKIEAIIRDEMGKLGGQEVLMPALQPRELWEETKRWDLMDVMYTFQDTSERWLSLGPTHEEVITDIVRKHVQSYKDLPFSLFQIQTKFRDEPRAKSGLLRGKEFSMKDLYSFHRTVEDLQDFYQRSITAYSNVFRRAGLEAFVVEASGGVFMKDYSHEFMVATPAGEDVTVFSSCGWAQNKAIAIARGGEKCSKCGDVLREEKTVESGNIFKLGTKFSADMKALFVDEDGTKKPIVMGCYGIGLSRLMGTIVEASHDEKGIIWPESVAPFTAHLLTAGKASDAVIKEADHLYAILQKNGVDILYDDRYDVQAGVKFSDADLVGIPWRLVVSEKTLEKKGMELKKRNEKDPKMVSLKEAVGHITQNT